MATYNGNDQRLAYLFQHGGGGGGASALTDLSDVDVTSPADGEGLLYDAQNQKWVNGPISGGGGAVNDGTVGVRIEVTLPHSSSVTFTFAELGITKYGSYWIFVNSKHAESGSSGWKWIGFAQYSGYYTSSFQTSYVTQMYASKVTVTMNEQAETITFANTNGTWDVDHLIEVLPLHPKIDVAKHAYSATEQVVGTWVDGKPLYELTTLLPITYSPQTGGAQNAGNQVIPVANVELITDLKILPLSPSTASHIQTCRTSAFQVSVTDVFAYSDKIQLNQMTFAANLTWVGVNGVYIIVQYTKTTD